jgi:type III secretion inner rod protein HrpB2
MIEAVQGISNTTAAAAAGPRPPEVQHLADQFDRMMAREPDVTIFSEQHLGIQGTPATAFVKSQEALMRHTYDDIRRFSIEAPQMGMQELASRHIDLTYQLAMVQLQFNAGVYLAQSGKSGIQTLMRNQ